MSFDHFFVNYLIPLIPFLFPIPYGYYWTQVYRSHRRNVQRKQQELLDLLRRATKK